MLDLLTHPLMILAIGIATILLLIIKLRANAFLALIAAALLVSLLSPGDTADKATRVAVAFGNSAGNIGIVIALAAIIGECLMLSGAADRVVRAFLHALGERRAGLALLLSGYVLAIPVFFDTVFYLLVPLARSLYRRTKKNFLLYVMAIGAGGAVTHTLVPPTPGPLLMASNLKVDVGLMILVGAAVALPAALVGLAFCNFLNRNMPLPMRDGSAADPALEDESKLPPLFWSVLPVVLPVALISLNTVLGTLAKAEAAELAPLRTAALVGGGAGPWQLTAAAAHALPPDTPLQSAAGVAALLGNANFALFLSALVAMAVLVRQRGLSMTALAEVVEKALMSGGVIILITAAGGAFGAMLTAARIGPAIQEAFGGGGGAGGLAVMGLGFVVAAVLKVAQGSSTVAMITASGMLASMAASPAALGFHPVYLAIAIGSGSLVGSWMNDSGFWIVSKMSGFTEVETLKTWTVLLVVLGFTGLVCSAALAVALPFPTGAP